MYEDAYARFFDLKNIWEGEGSSDQRKAISEELSHLAKSLEEEDPASDPLIDKWERELREGKQIDLEER